MKRLLVCVLAVVVVLAGRPRTIAQSPAEETASGAATQKREGKTPGGKAEAVSSGKSQSADSKPKGIDFNSGVSGPITTEIYADEAFFDSNKSVGIFRGHVKVNDPRFSLQSDKLTVFIKKGSQAGQGGPSAENSPNTQTGEGQGQGLEKAIAEGNVAVVRDRPDANGGPPTRAVGRAETATYVAASGDVELKGIPRVQQGLNTHIATSPETVMVINQSGQLTTHGPSRTEIRQQPKDEIGKDDKKGQKNEEKKGDGTGDKP